MVVVVVVVMTTTIQIDSNCFLIPPAKVMGFLWAGLGARHPGNCEPIIEKRKIKIECQEFA